MPRGFAGAFTSAFGADGAGTITYALGINGGNGVASGLVDVATGQNIVLVINAGVVEGHVGNAAGALAFTVTVDGAGSRHARPDPRGHAPRCQPTPTTRSPWPTTIWSR